MNQQTSTALLLTQLLELAERARHIRKLGPALYLAQREVGRSIYPYRLSMGHVVSDELAEEIAQLSSVGVLEWIDRDHVRPTDLALWGRDAFATENADAFRQALEAFIGEDPEALDAAATHVFFTDEGIGDPFKRLTWFRALPKEVADRARVVARNALGQAEEQVAP